MLGVVHIVALNGLDLHAQLFSQAVRPFLGRIVEGTVPKKRRPPQRPWSHLPTSRRWSGERHPASWRSRPKRPRASTAAATHAITRFIFFSSLSRSYGASVVAASEPLSRSPLLAGKEGDVSRSLSVTGRSSTGRSPLLEAPSVGAVVSPVVGSTGGLFAGHGGVAGHGTCRRSRSLFFSSFCCSRP